MLPHVCGFTRGSALTSESESAAKSSPIYLYNTFKLRVQPELLYKEHAAAINKHNV